MTKTKISLSKRILSLVLAFLMVATMFTMLTSAMSVNAAGENTYAGISLVSTDKYTIKNTATNQYIYYTAGDRYVSPDNSDGDFGALGLSGTLANNDAYQWYIYKLTGEDTYVFQNVANNEFMCFRSYNGDGNVSTDKIFGTKVWGEWNNGTKYYKSNVSGINLTDDSFTSEIAPLRKNADGRVHINGAGNLVWSWTGDRANSNWTFEKVKGDVPVTPSLNVKATANDKTVTVTWNAVDGATSYKVSRNNVVVGETNETSFTEVVENGTYTYTVTAVGVDEVLNNTATVTVTDSLTVPSVDGLTYLNGPFYVHVQNSTNYLYVKDNAVAIDGSDYAGDANHMWCIYSVNGIDNRYALINVGSGTFLNINDTNATLGDWTESTTPNTIHLYNYTNSGVYGGATIPDYVTNSYAANLINISIQDNKASAQNRLKYDNGNLTIVQGSGSHFTFAKADYPVKVVEPVAKPTVKLTASATYSEADKGTVSLSWVASGFETAGAQYKVYRDDTLLTTTAALTYTDTNVELGNYTYKVETTVDGEIVSSTAPVTVAAAPLSGKCDLEPMSVLPIYTNTPTAISAVVKNVGDSMPTFANRKLGMLVTVYDLNGNQMAQVWSDDHTADSGDLSAFLAPGKETTLTTCGGSGNNSDGKVTFTTAGRYRINVWINDQGDADCNNNNATNSRKDFYVNVTEKPQIVGNFKVSVEGGGEVSAYITKDDVDTTKVPGAVSGTNTWVGSVDGDFEMWDTVSSNYIHLEATENENYTFIGWQDVRNSSIITVDSKLDAPIGTRNHIKAMFAAKQSAVADQVKIYVRNNITGSLMSFGGTNYIAVTKGSTAAAALSGYDFSKEVKGFGVAGYKVGENQYNSLADIPALNEDTFITVLYTVSDTKDSSITVKGTELNDNPAFDITDNGDKSYTIKLAYNQSVKITSSDKDESGNDFSYWALETENGNKVVSNNISAVFITGEKNTTYVAVFGDDANKLTVPTNNIVGYSFDENSLYIQEMFNNPGDFKIIEKGAILVQDNGTAVTKLTFDTEGVLRGRSTAKNDSFYCRKKNAVGSNWYAQAYVIYQDANGQLVESYTGDLIHATADWVVIPDKSNDETTPIIDLSNFDNTDAANSYVSAAGGTYENGALNINCGTAASETRPNRPALLSFSIEYPEAYKYIVLEVKGTGDISQFEVGNVPYIDPLTGNESTGYRAFSTLKDYSGASLKALSADKQLWIIDLEKSGLTATDFDGDGQATLDLTFLFHGTGTISISDVYLSNSVTVTKN